jgi:hypothetical protein
LDEIARLDKDIATLLKEPVENGNGQTASN